MLSTPKFFLVLFLFLAASFGSWVAAQPPSLPEQQRQVAERFEQLEQILLRMSEVSATSNPRRAELLKKTLLAGKDKLVALRLAGLVEILQRRSLTEAAAGQETLEHDLRELLQLLESENREQRREREKEKIKELLRDLEEVLHQERALKTRTSQVEGEKLSALEKEQHAVRQRTQSLENRMSEDSSSETGDAPPPTEQAPAQQALQKAQERMQRAEEKMQQAEKQGMLEDQEEAIAELQKAKAELEKILRQMREEELLQTLEKLEARLQRMVRVEKSIRSQTATVGATANEPDETTARPVRIQAGQIAADQQAVLEDADAALVLLREDGTARAMVESLLQARFDMEDVRQRLEAAKLDAVTLATEDAVIAALEEMLHAVARAIDEAEKRKDNPPPGPGQGGNPGDEPLIQMLSELKMIRSMQRRVNERTQRYEAELQALPKTPLHHEKDIDDTVLRNRVEELARQQNRIARILHDLKVGKIQ